MWFIIICLIIIFMIKILHGWHRPSTFPPGKLYISLQSNLISQIYSKIIYTIIPNIYLTFYITFIAIFIICNNFHTYATYFIKVYNFIIIYKMYKTKNIFILCLYLKKKTLLSLLFKSIRFTLICCHPIYINKIFYSRTSRSADRGKHIRCETFGRRDEVLFSCLVSISRHLRTYRRLETRRS